MTNQDLIIVNSNVSVDLPAETLQTIKVTVSKSNIGIASELDRYSIKMCDFSVEKPANKKQLLDNLNISLQNLLDAKDTLKYFEKQEGALKEQINALQSPNLAEATTYINALAKNIATCRLALKDALEHFRSEFISSVIASIFNINKDFLGSNFKDAIVNFIIADFKGATTPESLERAKENCFTKYQHVVDRQVQDLNNFYGSLHRLEMALQTVDDDVFCRYVMTEIKLLKLKTDDVNADFIYIVNRIEGLHTELNEFKAKEREEAKRLKELEAVKLELEKVKQSQPVNEPVNEPVNSKAFGFASERFNVRFTNLTQAQLNALKVVAEQHKLNMEIL